MDRMHRYGDGLSTPTNQTIEHFLRDGCESGARRSPTSQALSPMLSREHDLEEDHIHGQHQKKSVLTKVKEKAKKLRHTLSSKKKHNEDGTTTPTWGVTLEDDEESEVEDAEYLGAPMYESELAPEGYKENARQHPRAVPVISEKHVLPSSIRQESPLSPNQAKYTTTSANANSTTTSPNKTITEAVAEKLAPAYATVSDATHAIASKLQNLAVSTAAAPQQPSSTPVGPQLSPITAASGSVLSPVVKQSYSAPISTGLAAQAGKNVVGGVDQQIWDKGVSVKQYLMHKFEPGEDERALSQVISEAMSPRRTSGGGGGGDHVGVVEKVKEAVTSLLRHDHQQEQPSISKSTYTRSATMPTTSTSRIPISTNAHGHEVGEEENCGRILQAN